jgi:FkbM family methyltransferase
MKIAACSEFIAGYLTESPQGMFLCPAYDKHIGASLLASGECKGNEIEWLRRTLRPEDEVLIVGAHIGTVAIPVSKFAKRVVAIEANPETFRYLRCNLILNGIENIELKSFAAASEFISLKFIAEKTNSGASKVFPKIPHPHYFVEPHKILEVEGAPLDEIFPEQVFRVIFMDIEGSEYSAFLGMKSLLASAEILFVEFIPYSLEFIAEASPEEFAGALEPFFNYLFVPKLGGFVEKLNFSSVLRYMYDSKISEDQIVFSKNLDCLTKMFSNTNN